MRSILGALVSGTDHLTVTDMEAGLEHLSRGTTRHVDTVLAVLEPYFKSMETGARVCALAHELGIKKIYALANKTRNQEEADAIQEFCGRRGLQLIGQVPYDESILKADLAGVAPMDLNPKVPSMEEIQRVGERLLSA